MGSAVEFDSLPPTPEVAEEFAPPEDLPFETEEAAGKMGRRFRHWVFTWNNYKPETMGDLIRAFHEANATYFVMGKEVGKSGTPHIQGTVCFTNARIMRQVSKIITKAWLAPAKDVQASIVYCKKDGDFTEWGTPPKLKNDGGKGEKAKAKWAEVRDLVNQGKLEEVDAQILICHYSNLKRMANDAGSTNARIYRHEDRVFYYLCGPAGTGKSRKARQMCSTYERTMLYVKNPETKGWFDGITAMHSLLLIEDIGPAHAWLATGLKLWMDAYLARVEVKGDTRFLNFAGGFITSNHPLRSIVAAADYPAVRRRCVMVWCPGTTGESPPPDETWATMESLPRWHPHIMRMVAEGPDAVFEPERAEEVPLTPEEAKAEMERMRNAPLINTPSPGGILPGSIGTFNVPSEYHGF